MSNGEHGSTKLKLNRCPWGCKGKFWKPEDDAFDSPTITCSPAVGHHHVLVRAKTVEEAIRVWNREAQ